MADKTANEVVESLGWPTRMPEGVDLNSRHCFYLADVDREKYTFFILSDEELKKFERDTVEKFQQLSGEIIANLLSDELKKDSTANTVSVLLIIYLIKSQLYQHWRNSVNMDKYCHGIVIVTDEVVRSSMLPSPDTLVYAPNEIYEYALSLLQRDDAEAGMH